MGRGQGEKGSVAVVGRFSARSAIGQALPERLWIDVAQEYIDNPSTPNFSRSVIEKKLQAYKESKGVYAKSNKELLADEIASSVQNGSTPTQRALYQKLQQISRQESQAAGQELVGLLDEASLAKFDEHSSFSPQLRAFVRSHQLARRLRGRTGTAADCARRLLDEWKDVDGWRSPHGSGGRAAIIGILVRAATDPQLQAAQSAFDESKAAEQYRDMASLLTGKPSRCQGEIVVGKEEMDFLVNGSSAAWVEDAHAVFVQVDAAKSAADNNTVDHVLLHESLHGAQDHIGLSLISGLVEACTDSVARRHATNRLEPVHKYDGLVFVGDAFQERLGLSEKEVASCNIEAIDNACDRLSVDALALNRLCNELLSEPFEDRDLARKDEGERLARTKRLYDRVHSAFDELGVPKAATNV